MEADAVRPDFATVGELWSGARIGKEFADNRRLGDFTVVCITVAGNGEAASLVQGGNLE